MRMYDLSQQYAARAFPVFHFLKVYMESFHQHRRRYYRGRTYPKNKRLNREPPESVFRVGSTECVVEDAATVRISFETR